MTPWIQQACSVRPRTITLLELGMLLLSISKKQLASAFDVLPLPTYSFVFLASKLWKDNDNMPVDRLLNTVLGAYQRVHDADQTNRLLSSTTSLLTTLSNPLNVTLLTSQLLTAPAVWSQDNGLATSIRIITIYNTAAITVRQHELDSQGEDASRQGGGLHCDEWARAVIKGADDRSARWQHLLVMAGVLLGMENQSRRGLSRGLRSTLEGAIVTAANLALQDPARDGVLGAESIVLALSHAFPLISRPTARSLNHDALAQIAVRAMISNEGYQEGLFLGAVDMDVREVGGRFEWPQKSPSFVQLQRLGSKPLISAMGLLSKLLAYSIENLSSSGNAVLVLNDVLDFSCVLNNQWRRNKLSQVNSFEETSILTPDTRRITCAALWQTLKTTMFASVIALRAILGRTLVDPILASDAMAPSIASKSLEVLRNLSFIASRIGSNALTAHTFVNLTSIDILSRFPVQSRLFLTQIRSTHAGQIPSHALDRNLDLFYLNTCEHFTLVLSPSDNEHLVAVPATPYLHPNNDVSLIDLFEAAHAAMLAALAAPQNAALTARILPFYTDSLFASFPVNLSPRQFRFAFKSLIQITAPPAPLSASHPDLPDTLCEVLRHRALFASKLPLPPTASAQADASSKENEGQVPLSEQAVLVLTLIDALPFLPRASLEEWLPMTADLMNAIEDTGMRNVARRRFWEVLESGEMDVERSSVGVTWWTSRGGREMVLNGRDMREDVLMSGGLGGGERQSRL